MKYLMTHLSVHLHGEKVLNTGCNVKKLPGQFRRKDIFLCQCSEADRMLKGLTFFLPFKWKPQLCKFKISRLQQLQIRVNVPWFPSQGYLNSYSINYLCTQHFEIQWAACSPKS